MRSTLLRAALPLLLLVGAAGAASASTVLRLPSEVEVRGDQVLVGDLSLDDVPELLAEQAVMPAPAAGHDRRVSRELLRRLLVQAGVRPLPELMGAVTIRISRAGRRVDTTSLARRVEAMLAEHPLPAGAVDQTFEVKHLPEVFVPPGDFEVVLEDSPPRAGRGGIRVSLVESSGRRRSFFAQVERRLLTPAWVSRRALEGGRPLMMADAVAETLWVADAVRFDNLLPSTVNLDGSSTLIRAVRGGQILSRRDLRATPVIRRGEVVQWIQERHGITVTLDVQARSNGAPGDWILVENPLDGRLRRVCVWGQGLVRNRAPSSPRSRSAATSTDPNLSVTRRNP